LAGAPENFDLSVNGIGTELADRDLLQYFTVIR
jgi:hypothetical protein